MQSEQTRREIDRLIESGWRIETETPERTVLVKREYGDLVVHLLIFVVTFWTGGVANAIYAAYKYLNSPKRVVRDEHRTCPSCGAAVAPGAGYCGSCGTELPSLEPATRTCDDCGATVPAGAKFCPDCGAEVAATADE